jgi:hypothetical protein
MGTSYFLYIFSSVLLNGVLEKKSHVIVRFDKVIHTRPSCLLLAQIYAVYGKSSG